MLHSSTPSGPGPGTSLLATFEEEGIQVFSTHLVVGRRRWMLGELLRAEVVREAPHWRPYTVALGAGLLLALGLMISLLGRVSVDGALHGVGLFVAACLIFGSLARILLLTDTSWLVLRMPGGSERAYGSTDHAFVVFVATLLSDAMRAAPRPH